MGQAGFVLFNKPSGITSAQAIAIIKRKLNTKQKIGHAGTLDSFACGLLVVGIGRPATRLLRHVMQLDKTYHAQVACGYETDTLDTYGKVIKTSSKTLFTQSDIESTFSCFMPSYYQIPPAFCALKYKGKRLSDWARTHPINKVEEILPFKQRDISVYQLQVEVIEGLHWNLKASVSSGTYIRSLVRDIAYKLQTVATTTSLRRSAIGPFFLVDALPVKYVTKQDIVSRIIPVSQIMSILRLK